MEKYMKADSRNPFMGLNNKICLNPVYWCRLHQVWLSKEDAERKKCRKKEDFDMFGTHRCGNLEKKIKMQQDGRKNIEKSHYNNTAMCSISGNRKETV